MSKYGSYEDKEFVAEFYDPVYDRLATRDITLYVEYSQKALGRTLELGCGTGRVLIPTAAAGGEITGLDLSSYMLDKCREKLAEQPQDVQQRVKLIQGNMTDFDTGETYSLVIIPIRSFQHLVTVEEQKACLTCIHRHLDAKGQLIIDIFNPDPEKLADNPGNKIEIENLTETPLPDGRKLRRAGRLTGFHPEEQYNDVELIYYVTSPDGKTERYVQAFPMRYFFRYEMEHLLEICGFKVVELFGDFDKSAYSGDSPEMIFIAEKAS